MIAGAIWVTIALAMPAMVAADCAIDDPGCLELVPSEGAPGTLVSGGFGGLGWSDGTVGDRCGSLATLTFFTGTIDSGVRGVAEVSIADDWTGTFRVPAVAAGEYGLAISCPPELPDAEPLAATFTVLPAVPDTSLADPTGSWPGEPVALAALVLGVAALVLLSGARHPRRSV